MIDLWLNQVDQLSIAQMAVLFTLSLIALALTYSVAKEGK